MAVAILRDGTEIKFADSRYSKMMSNWESLKKKGMINITGAPERWVSPSSVAQTMTDAQYDAMIHEKKGDWQCKDSHWHPKHETICGIANPNPKDLPASFIHQRPAGFVPSTRTEQWKEIIRRNMAALRSTGKYGTLRAIEELENATSPA